MQKIRIKKQPQPGDQYDYSLVDRYGFSYPYGTTATTSTDDTVKNTLTAVPEEEANIEVEGGETVVGDVNQDGLVEHFEFKGKSHAQGGIPAAIPEGSFIFSNTKKLRIKDKGVQEAFGMSYKKEGYTPAEISKKYKLNEYINTLKSEDTDEMSKRSADQMVKNHMEKLGMLALVQESMKGFPDGIPAIAESALAGLQGGQPGQEQQVPEAKYGGRILPKAQAGKQVGKVGSVVYINNKPVKIKTRYVGIGGNEWVTFDKPIQLKNSRGKVEDVTELKVADLNKGLTKGSLNLASDEGFFGVGANYEDVDRLKGSMNRPLASPGTGNTFNKVVFSTTKNAAPAKTPRHLQPGFKYTQGNTEYTVVNPNVYDGSGQSVQVRQGSDPNRNVGSFFDSYAGNKIIPIEEYNRLFASANPVAPAVQNQRPENTLMVNAPGVEVMNETLAPTPVRTTVAQKTPAKKTVVTKTTSQPSTQKVSTPVLNKNDVWSDEEFAFGGDVKPKYQSQGEVTAQDGKTVDHYEYSKKTGNRRAVYTDGTKGPVEATGINYDVADEDLRKEVNAKKYDFIELQDQFRYKNKSVGPQTKQTGYKVDPESGFLYKDIKPGAAGLANYMEIHKEAIDNFPGGAEEWKRVMLANPGKENAAMTHLLMYENDAIGPLSGNRNYVDLNKKGALVPGVENFNLPGIRKQPEPISENPVANAPEKDITIPAPLEKTPVKNGPWWLQDTTNFVGTMTDEINRYEPLLGMVDLETPGYVLKDPTRMLANNQESMARFQNQAENSMDGNVAAATMLGSTGEGLAQGANNLSQVESENVGIVNNAYANNAQINNQERLMNEAARQKYVGEMAMLNQNIDEDKNIRKWRQISAFNKGTENWHKKKLMEQVLFPQFYIDPIMGDMEYSGRERDILGPDTYVNPMSGNASGNMSLMSQTADAARNAYDETYKAAFPAYGKDVAEKMAMEAYKRYDKVVPSAAPYNARQEFGKTMLQKRFGGAITPWDFDID